MAWAWLHRVHAAALAPLGLLLFPPACGGCAAPQARRPAFALCPLCTSTLKPAASPQVPGCDAAHASWRYVGALRALVRAAKFAHREELCTALGELLAADPQVRAMLPQNACIVPLPLGARRFAQRGYNPSAAIARVLARRLHLPLRHALRRSRDTPAQSSLPAKLRQQNVADAFAARLPLPACVALVDDVITSGATGAAAALACRRAGARTVFLLAPAGASC